MSKINFIVLYLVITCLSGCFDASEVQLQKFSKSHEQNYVDVKEGKLFYQTFGHGDPMIVLHGGPGMDQNYLLPQMLELAKDHKITFYDQRGSGKSLDTKVDGKTININQFVEDLEILRAKLGYKRFTLIGHSWGGFLAMHYAIAYKEHLQALILLNSIPATLKGTQAFAREYNKITAPVKKRIEEIYNSPDFAQGEPKLVEEFYYLVFPKYLAKEADLQKLSLKVSQNSTNGGFKKINDIFFQNDLSKPYNLTSDLNKLNIPTLVVHADKDPVPLWTAQEIHNSIPHSKLLVIKDCGHFPYVEKPEELFKGIRKFLRGKT